MDLLLPTIIPPSAASRDDRNNPWTNFRPYGIRRDRPLLASVQNDTEDTISRYAYQYDAVGRRTSVLTTGSVFGAGAYNLWGYNDRSELTSSKRYTGSQVPVPPNLPDPEVPAERRLYTYDTIGNRKDRTAGTGGSAMLYYCANNLNQYVTTDD